MLRARYIILYSLFCLHVILHKAVARGIESQRTYFVGSDEYVNLAIDWKCESNLDCTVATSRCVDNTCRCNRGYIYNSNMTSCIKVATAYGDRCEESIQCSRYLLNGGICMNATCVCADGYYYMHGRCYAYVGLFEKCRKDVDCYVSGNFEATACDNETCRCSPGYYQREYRTCRPEGKGVGAKCVIDHDCKVFNNTAQCDYQNLCVLPDAGKRASLYINSPNTPEKNRVNKLEVTIGSKCTKDADCKDLQNSFCEPSGTCVCKRAHFFHTDSGKCVPELGEPCQSKDAVIIDYSECRNGRWSCELDRAVTKDNRKCLKAIKRYNNYCREDLQCFVFGPDAICKENKCVCNENSRFDESELFCWTKRGIGEVCMNDVDCFVDGLSAKLSCANNVCSCPESTRPNANRTSCVSASAGIGMSCEVHSDCTQEHTECVNEVCACMENYYESDKKCLPGIHAACKADADCSIENSECTSGSCTCKEGYVAPSIRSCLTVASHGQPCEQDIQCASKLPNAICALTENATESLCTCAEGYHYNFDRCYKRKVLGMSCEYLGECYLDSGDRVVCKNGVCACDWNYAQVNNTVCRPVQHFNINGGSIGTGMLGLVSMTVLLLIRLI